MTEEMGFSLYDRILIIITNNNVIKVKELTDC